MKETNSNAKFVALLGVEQYIKVCSLIEDNNLNKS
jgi:hypothetical protein